MSRHAHNTLLNSYELRLLLLLLLGVRGLGRRTTSAPRVCINRASSEARSRGRRGSGGGRDHLWRAWYLSAGLVLLHCLVVWRSSWLRAAAWTTVQDLASCLDDSQHTVLGKASHLSYHSFPPVLKNSGSRGGGGDCRYSRAYLTRPCEYQMGYRKVLCETSTLCS